MNQKKQKLLNRYILPLQTNVNKKQKNAQYSSSNNVWLKDDDMIAADRESVSSESGEDQPKRARIDSDSEENGDARNENDRKNEKQRKLKQRQEKKQKKLHKKLKKTFGLEKDDQVEQFLSNLQIEGIDKSELLQYLKQNKTAIIKKEGDQEQNANAQKKNKKKDKKKKKDKEGQDGKFSKFQQSQSSDMEIPNQARTKTIYRNKDGTIKDCSIKEEKEKHKNTVFERLAEWQRGMKKQESDHQLEINEDLNLAKHNKIWDDPMKRWEGEAPRKFLSCNFEGAPNRYGIKPGYRWDGVIRGNGFQNRYLQQINLRKAKKAQEHMQYMKNL